MSNTETVFPTPHSVAVRTPSGLLVADTFDALVRRAQNEYLEMPGLSLTLAQAQRLWGLRRTDCEELFTALVDARFLMRTAGGVFLRANSGRAGA